MGSAGFVRCALHGPASAESATFTLEVLAYQRQQFGRREPARQPPATAHDQAVSRIVKNAHGPQTRRHAAVAVEFCGVQVGAAAFDTEVLSLYSSSDEEATPSIGSSADHLERWVYALERFPSRLLSTSTLNSARPSGIDKDQISGPIKRTPTKTSTPN